MTEQTAGVSLALSLLSPVRPRRCVVSETASDPHRPRPVREAVDAEQAHGLQLENSIFMQEQPRLTREGGNSMSAEANKAIVNRLYDEVFNQRKLAVTDDLIASDYTRHDPANPHFRSGLEGYKQFQSAFLRAFPDGHFTVTDQIAAGDKVVTRWTTTGMQTGDLPGIPATRKHVTITGITISRIENGKIAEDWQEWDQLGMLRQLGVVSAV